MARTSNKDNYNRPPSAISAETSVRMPVPTFSLDEFNNFSFLSSGLDKDPSLLSFNRPSTLAHHYSLYNSHPSVTGTSSSSSPSSSNTDPPTRNGPLKQGNLFHKLKRSASSLVLKTNQTIHEYGGIGATTPTVKQPIKSTSSPSSPLKSESQPANQLSLPTPVRKHVLPRSRSISFLSFSHSHSSSPSTSSSVSDIKRSLSKLKHSPSLRSLRSIIRSNPSPSLSPSINPRPLPRPRSGSSKASLSLSFRTSLSLSQPQSISRRAISNPSPVLANSIISSPDSNPVRDCSDFAYGLAFECPRRAPRPPSSFFTPAPGSSTFSESTTPSYPEDYDEGEGEGEPEPEMLSDMEEDQKSHTSFNFEPSDLGLGPGFGLSLQDGAEDFHRRGAGDSGAGGSGGLRDSGLGFLDGVSVSEFGVSPPEQRRLHDWSSSNLNSKTDLGTEFHAHELPEPTTPTKATSATPTATSTPKRSPRSGGYRAKAAPRLCNLTVPAFSTYTTTTVTSSTTTTATEYLHPNSASVPSSPLGSGLGLASGGSGSISPASTPTPTATSTAIPAVPGISTASTTTSTTRPSELDYTPTTTPTYPTHPYARVQGHDPTHHLSLPSLSPSLSQHTTISHSSSNPTFTPSQQPTPNQSPLPTPLSTMFFPLPPPASPSLLEALSGVARAAVGVSARISVSLGGGGGGGCKEKDKGKERERDVVTECVREKGWKTKAKTKNGTRCDGAVPAPLPSLKKKESRASFKALLSRLSPTSSVFNLKSPSTPTASSSRSHSRARGRPRHPHAHADPLMSPILHITAPATSPVDSCVSLVFSSDGEDEDEDGVGSPLAPLTPLEPSFGQNASVVRIGVAGDHQPENEQSRTRSLLDDNHNGPGAGAGGGYATMPEVVSKDKGREKRLLHARSFSLNRSPSTRSQPSLLGVLDSLDHPTRSGLSSPPSLSTLRARRRRASQVQQQVHPPPFHPLPTPPSHRHHLPSASTPSSSKSPPPPPSSSSHSPSPTADWTLALPLLVERPGPLSLKHEHAKDAEYKRLREEQRRRDDWTLGLDLAWSAGLLMGDKRGDGRTRGASSLPRSRSSSLRQQKQAARAGEKNAKATRSPSRLIRPSSPFPLVDGRRSRKVSLAVVDENEDIDVRNGGNSGSGNGGGSKTGEQMERALQALLSDAGESRVEDKTMTSSSREPWSSSSSSVSHSDSLSEGVEWSLRTQPRPGAISPNEHQETQAGYHVRPAADADRASIISGPYYSARSSWRQSWQSALKTIKTGPAETLASHLDFSCIAAAPSTLS